METALNEEMTEHLGHAKNRAVDGRDSTNIRTGTRPKTVLTHATGDVVLDVPRDRDGTFQPVIVKKRQRWLTEVDEIVLSLYAAVANVLPAIGPSRWTRGERRRRSWRPVSISESVQSDELRPWRPIQALIASVAIWVLIVNTGLEE